jgi:S-formylglutathione hydrolase FrmB
VSLISGFIPNLIVCLSLAVLIAGIGWRSGPWRRQLLAGALTALALTSVLAFSQLAFAWVPYPFPVRYYLWVGGVMFALGLCAFGRGIGWWRRMLSVLAVPLIALSAVVLINADYQYYPNVESLFGVGAQHTTSVPDLLARRRALGFDTESAARPATSVLGGTRGVPGASDIGASTPQRLSDGDVGESVQVSIPATVSHFSARPAWVWVPPAYVSGQVETLPVLMLLAGSPGRPSDWLRAAFADRTAESYARRHDGVAPILVMPDENGSLTADTECVNGPAGAAETYLTVDVPAFMHAEFGAPIHHGYAVAGFSEGGTCAVMLALRHPDLFTAFGDFSALTSPTLTETVNASATAKSLFHGSMSAYRAHDPLTLLRRHNLHGNACFVVGTEDKPGLRAQRQLAALARAAGLSVFAREVPGAGHTYGLWAEALADTMPGLANELGLTNGSVLTNGAGTNGVGHTPSP